MWVKIFRNSGYFEVVGGRLLGTSKPSCDPLIVPLAKRHCCKRRANSWRFSTIHRNGLWLISIIQQFDMQHYRLFDCRVNNCLVNKDDIKIRSGGPSKAAFLPSAKFKH